MNNNVSKSGYSFWLLKSKPNKDGEVPIRMQISLSTNRIQLSTGVWVKEKNFDDKRQQIKSKDADAELKNKKLDALAQSYKDSYIFLLRTSDDFILQSIKEKMFGKDVSIKTIIQLFTEFNDELEKIKGKGCFISKYQRFKLMDSIIRKFIHARYNRMDIELSKLSPVFLSDLYVYLKSERNVSHNTAIKFIKRFKQITNYGIMKQYLNVNPFLGFKAKMEPTNMPFLTENELKLIEDKEMPIERLKNVKHIFLLQCYTGLSYIDVKKLTKENIIEVNGQRWLFTNRDKTKVEVRVPLMGKVEELMNESTALNIPSNQRMNSYLKEIADVCGITKNLTTHVARRTFATMYLTNGVSMEPVSRMLGHTNINTTSIYAKILPDKVQREMKEMQQKLIERKKKNKKK
jgi:integrase